MQYDSVDQAKANPPPEPLHGLFNDPGAARVQKLPSELPGLDCKAVYFPAGVRTMPHRHTEGQQIIVVDGKGVVGDEDGVQVVSPGDVVSSPPGGWHWHGALPHSAMTHVTVEDPGLDLDVERRDWDEVYTDDLGR